MTRIRHSLLECVEMAKSHCGECLSAEYANSNIRMLWRCANGHEWLSKFSSILQGHWCQKCHLGSLKHYSIKDCIDFAASKGGKCLSHKYKNGELIEWECSNGHKWKSAFDHILSGKWCGICLRNIKRSKYLKDCHDVASIRFGQCLSDEFVNAKSAIKWSCSLGHTWTACFNSVKHGTWCPACADMDKKYSINDCIQFAQTKDGRCLGQKYTNSYTKIEWECECGHRWLQCYRDIKRGKWCPKCKFGKTQRLLSEICASILGFAPISPFRGFEWLKTGRGNGRQEIDIWIPELKLAIEYDGAQHRKAVRFDSMSQEEADDKLLNQIELDKMKNIKIAAHSDEVRYFLRFNDTEIIDEEHVFDKLKLAGVI
jgi:very-short-patch-repair endonuclease